MGIPSTIGRGRARARRCRRCIGTPALPHRRPTGFAALAVCRFLGFQCLHILFLQQDLGLERGHLRGEGSMFSLGFQVPTPGLVVTFRFVRLGPCLLNQSRRAGGE